MNITKIGRYTIMSIPNKWKQIYSPNGKMLQVNNNRVFYVDLVKMKVLKEFKRVLKWMKN